MDQRRFALAQVWLCVCSCAIIVWHSWSLSRSVGDRGLSLQFAVRSHRRLARPIGSTLWRGNRYIDRDGILPYQRCGANATAVGPAPLHTQYTTGNATYDLVVLAASVWGQAHGARDAPDLHVVEILAFDTPHGEACKMGPGRHGVHCTPTMDASHAKHVGNVTCKFAFGDSRVSNAGEVRPHKTKGRVGAFVIVCPFPDGLFNAGGLPDLWTVTVSLGGGAVPVDICYDHVHKPIDIVLCTEPAYGFSRGSDFWGGDPPFAANQTMLDAFLTYHTEMMGAHVRFNDLDADTREAVLPYTSGGRVSYRPGWRLSPLAGAQDDWIARLGLSEAAGDAAAFEVLAYAACHWEFRYRARWAMMVSSVDNFVAPVQDVSLVRALKSADIADVSSMHVPTVEGFSLNGSLALASGANALLRYPVAGPDLAFGDTKHTPIIDPRHLETVWVHWATEYRPHGGRQRVSLSPKELLETLQLRTLHLMALTRPVRDKGGNRSGDELLLKRGAELQAHLEAAQTVGTPRT